MKERSLGYRVGFVVAAVVLLVIANFLPVPEELGYPGKMSLALLIVGIILWVAEPVPMAISALGLMVLAPFFGIIETASVWTNFISSVIFFVLACFGITAALLKTKIPKKIVFGLAKLTKGSSKGIVAAFILATTLVSMFISDLPATALFAGIAMSSVLEVQKAEPGKSKFGKAMMIGIAMGSITGGLATPAGSSLNVMAMGMAASQGVHITFLQWSAVAIPCVVIITVLTYLSLVLIYKPEPLSEETKQSIVEGSKDLGKFEAIDWKVLVIFIIMIAAWVASNWTGWDATTIAILGLVAFFLPGIDVLTWKEYLASISWAIVLLMGGVQSIAGGISYTGSAKWLLNSTVGQFASSALVFTAAVSVILPIIRLAIPVGPAFIGICLMPLIGIAGSFGVSAATMVFIVAFNGSCTYLLGIDNNHMLTYRYNYWTMADFFKAGIIPCIGMMVCNAFLINPLITMMGI